jgi:ubiquitin carboxyl-terminal hydrolase 34
MDDRVLATLKQCIRGETSTQVMDPFLRAAVPYIDSTNKLANAMGIVQHISTQVRSLQNTEGVYFVRFFRTAVSLEKEDEGFAVAVRSYSLGQVSQWVPLLLAWPDQQVRRVTKDFLDSVLFDVLKGYGPAIGVNTRHNNDGIKETTRQVGIMCLEYLKDHHVRRRTSVNREVATGFLEVIERCGVAVDMESNEPNDADKRFHRLHDGKWNVLCSGVVINKWLTSVIDVIDPLRKLVVDDMEDDGSGMLQSFSDSDTIIADLW